MNIRAKEQAREALLDAGLQLWADGGWPAVTLAATGAAAGVAAADFHDEFPTDIALACGIFDHIVDERASAMISAVAAAPPSMAQRTRACLEAMVDDVGPDHRRAVVLSEPVGCPALQARRRSANRGFAAMVATENAETRAAHEDLLAAGHFCLGGLGELVFAWLDPATPVDRDLVIEHGVRLFEACVRIK